MNKNFKLTIKLLSLLFSIVLIFESSAAIVSDNDGSAFVTKAEFEALKKDFDKQIENYNDSIDNKIDGAIASYLAGIQIGKKESKSILIPDWEKYTMMNKSIANDYVYPDFSGQYSLFKYATEYGSGPASTATWNTKIFFSRNVMNYVRTGKANKKVLVDNVEIGDTLNVENTTWAGIATNAKESFNFARHDLQDSFSDGDPAYLFATHTNYFIICTVYNIRLNGYVRSSDLNSISSPVWNLGLRWVWNTGRTNWVIKPVFISNEVKISYEKDDDDNIYDYLHVGNWLGSTTWECNAKGVNNYFTTSSKNTLRTKAWVDASTMEGVWDGVEASNATYYNSDGSEARPHIQRGAKFTQTTTIRDENTSDATNNSTIPTIGLIGDLTASQIYQFNNNDLFDNDGNAIDRVKMQQGIPIFHVKEDEVVEWTANFKNVDSTLTNKYIVAMFSYVPFSNDSTLTTGNMKDYVLMDWTGYDTTKYGKYLKGTEGGVSYYFPRTDKYSSTTKTCKVPIKFKADRSGIVYLKFFVYDGSSDSSIAGSWEATLDIENSNSYISTN